MPPTPSPLSDLIGQPLAVSLLSRSLSQSQIATTYLFNGNAGLGKETAARLFAQQLLQCTALDTCPDFILTTALESRQIKVQQIRDLLQQLTTYPLQSARRVVIVREAHTLNEAAGNALLKTLEDSRLTTFLLLCDQPLSLRTIRSRGQVIPFYPLTATDLQTVLGRVAPVLLDYPELLRSAGGAVGAAIEGWQQAAQCADLKEGLQSLPTDGESLYALSQALSQKPPAVQQWLLRFLGWSGWQHPGVLMALEAAQRQLKQHCYPLTVWEQLLRRLAGTPLTVRLEAPLWEAADAELEADSTLETEHTSPEPVTAPPAKQPDTVQQSLFSYRA